MGDKELMHFDEVIDRRNTESLKWNYYDDDVIPLWVADMDFRCPKPVIEALHQRIDHGIFGYGLPPADLTTIIQDRMKGLYSWEIEPEEVSFVPGCVTGFNLAIHALCNKGDSVIVQTPVYPPFLSAPAEAGVLRVDNPLLYDDSYYYRIDYEFFEKQIVANKVKLFILCNPHNPVGRVFRKDELERLAEICLRNHVIICSDEIHCDLIFSGHKHIPIASLAPEIADITITLLAPSKTYNIAGLHSSVSIIKNKELRNRFNKARAGLIGNPGILGLAAARAAYLYGNNWLQSVLAYLENNRDWLYEEIAERIPTIQMTRPEGTFLTWMDCSRLQLKPNPYAYFLSKAKVGLNDGASFGGEASQFVRFNFASPQIILKEAVDRIYRALLQDGLLT
jgi:cystathionine beta-lyase